MAEVQDVAVVTESSPVTPTPEAKAEPAPKSGQDTLNEMTKEQRADWKRTGKLPEVKPVESDSGADKAETEAESETAPTEQRKGNTNAETRIKHLVAEAK